MENHKQKLSVKNYLKTLSKTLNSVQYQVLCHGANIKLNLNKAKESIRAAKEVAVHFTKCFLFTFASIRISNIRHFQSCNREK